MQVKTSLEQVNNSLDILVKHFKNHFEMSGYTFCLFFNIIFISAFFLSISAHLSLHLVLVKYYGSYWV